MAIKDTNDLRALLVDTIEKLHANKIDANRAKAVSALSGRVLQAAELDLQYLKYANGKRAFGAKTTLVKGKK